VYNRFLLLAAPARNSKPTSPPLFHFPGCAAAGRAVIHLLPRRIDKTAVLLDQHPSRATSDDDPAVPGQDRILYWHWRKFL
jgi:hypothetical protein